MSCLRWLREASGDVGRLNCSSVARQCSVAAAKSVVCGSLHYSTRYGFFCLDATVISNRVASLRLSREESLQVAARVE